VENRKINMSADIPMEGIASAAATAQPLLAQLLYLWCDEQRSAS